MDDPVWAPQAGQVLMDNRKGLAVDAMLTQATGTAGRDAADVMVTERRSGRGDVRLGEHSGSDAQDATSRDGPHQFLGRTS